MRAAALRTALLAAGLTVASAWLVQRVGLLYGGPALAGTSAPEQVYVAVPVLVLALSGLAGRWLDRGERAVLYAALTIGITATGAGLAHRFLPGLVTPLYGGFANPAGPYFRFVQSMPQWMVPGRPGSDAAVGAFEGHAAVPWAAWAMPLACWSALFAFFFLTCASLVGIVRHRWLDIERLGFPLLEMPLALLGGGLFRRALFWCGVGVPVLLFGVNGLHHYYPTVGEIKLTLDMADFLLEEPWKAMAASETPFVFEFAPLLIGVAYLAPVEISLSTWVFFLVTRVELLLTHLVGRTEYRGEFIPGHGANWLDWPSHFPFFMSQARGGLLFLAAFSLWLGRRSLAEALSPRRRPLWGLAVGLLGLWLWTWAAGVPALLGLACLLLFLLLTLACVRLRVDGGLPLTGVPQVMGYFAFVALGTGPGVFADRTYAAFGYLGVLGFTVVGMWPAMQLEGLKLAERTGVSARRMLWTMVLALGVGLVSGYVFSLETMYQHGLFTLQEQGGARAEARIGRYYAYLIREAGTIRGTTDWARLGFHAAGAGVTWALCLLRQRFLRWPLHPMGFVYGTGFGWTIWGAALVGWLCKWLTVRYGGATTYRRVQPFFLGLILGEVGMRLLWAGVAVWQAKLGAGYAM